MRVNYFFINFTLKTKEKSNLFNANIEKVLSCVCHAHAHDFSTPVHSLSF